MSSSAMAPAEVAALYLRIQGRRTRVRLRHLLADVRARLDHHNSALHLRLSPIEVPADSPFAEVEIRTPTSRDARVFQQKLVDCASQLARQHPRIDAPPDAFAPECAVATWRRRIAQERQQIARGVRYAGLILAQGQLIGELALRIDLGTSSGEILCWCDDTAAARAAVAALLREILGKPGAPARFFAEVQCAPHRPADVVMTGEFFASLGFHCEGVFINARRYDGVPYDHEVWVAHNTPELLAALAPE